MPRRSVLRPDEYAKACGGRVVRVADLGCIGVNRSTVAERCRAGGPWTRLMPGIVKLDNAPATRDDRRRAALLHAGQGAVLTGADALQLHGVRQIPAPSGPVHVLIPTARRRVGNGRVYAERTERLPPAVPGRWPLAPLVRAVLDFCRRTTDRALVRALVAEVVQRGSCTPGELWEELEEGSGRGTALPRSVLREVGAGVRSVAEATAREILESSGLPAPSWNVRLFDRHGRFVATPDGWFKEVGLAWEIDSFEWHMSPADYARTLDRRAALMAHGVIVLHTVPSKLQNREKVLEELRAAYALAASCPPPTVVEWRTS